MHLFVTNDRQGTFTVRPQKESLIRERWGDRGVNLETRFHKNFPLEGIFLVETMTLKREQGLDREKDEKEVSRVVEVIM